MCTMSFECCFVLFSCLLVHVWRLGLVRLNRRARACGESCQGRRTWKGNGEKHGAGQQHDERNPKHRRAPVHIRIKRHSRSAMGTAAPQSRAALAAKKKRKQGTHTHTHAGRGQAYADVNARSHTCTTDVQLCERERREGICTHATRGKPKMTGPR